MAGLTRSFREIIDLWGKRVDLCADIGVTPGALNQMITRNSISSKYWAAMVVAAQERGITGVSLTSLAAAAASREKEEAARSAA